MSKKRERSWDIDHTKPIPIEVIERWSKEPITLDNSAARVAVRFAKEILELRAFLQPFAKHCSMVEVVHIGPDHGSSGLTLKMGELRKIRDHLNR